MSQTPAKNPLVAIVGPTASGKTRLAVQLARQFNGEIVSADSRQVYRGLNLTFGKDLEEYTLPETAQKIKAKSGPTAAPITIPYHLIDVCDPKQTFTLADYKKLADEKLKEISKRKKLPILAGGTGLYLKAVIYDFELPLGEPDPVLRKKLIRTPLAELISLLKLQDPAALDLIDLNNPHRVIRALEIINTGKKYSQLRKEALNKELIPRYPTLQLGIAYPIETLRKRIKARIEERIKNGMIEEVEQAIKQGLSFERLNELGLECRYVSLYLKKRLTKKEMLEQLTTASGQFAKRQLTWFKKDPNILWLNAKDPSKEAEEILTKSGIAINF